MASLTVWLFDAEHTAAVLDTTRRLKASGWIDCYDAALVRWAADGESPQIEPQPELADSRAFGRQFWPRLFTVTFFPQAYGAGASGVAAALGDDELSATPELARELREQVRPGRAALFVYSSGELAATGAHAEEIRASLKGVPTRLLRSNLSAEQHDRLLEVFGR